MPPVLLLAHALHACGGLIFAGMFEYMCFIFITFKLLNLVIIFQIPGFTFSSWFDRKV